MRRRYARPRRRPARRQPPPAPVDPGPEDHGGQVAVEPQQAEAFAGRRVRNGDWPPRDKRGRGILWRMNSITMFRACPWLIEAFDKVVPDQFWSIELDDDEEPVATVACVCGESPRVQLAKSAECGCGRFFVFTGKEVRCFRPEEDAQEQPDS